MNQNYTAFGDYIRNIRKKRKESLAEVSGAVEIDTSYLNDMESGFLKPSEDILFLLISYFSLNEDEALKLWNLAGYDQSKFGRISLNNGVKQEVITLSDNEPPIFYTDMVHVSANSHGVVIDFLQGHMNGKASTISRVGMSREHAKSFMALIKKTMELSSKNTKQRKNRGSKKDSK